MFESFDLSRFGDHLRKLRKSLGYTQSDVEALCGVTADALRRIENGRVVPRYDTLIYLSHIYKKDLLADLTMYSSASQIFELYSRLEDLLIRHDMNALQQLYEDFAVYMATTPEKGTLVNLSVVKQFEWMLSGIQKYYTCDQVIQRECGKDFLEAVKISHPSFTPAQFARFGYTEFEHRILLMIATSITDDLHLANSILRFCLEHLNKGLYATTAEKMFRIKIYFNLSYNYHRLDQHEKALLAANEGIHSCNEDHLSYYLGALLFRKGIAAFLLKQPDYMECLQLALHMLVIQDNQELAQLYKKIALETYGITIKT
ncbi:MAG TPA: helix-turn-helix domain-containing protein [Firmicutes bacterium]|nr:helix-turn-helix domain-containing protein [Bacillota bacterium]